MLVLSRKENQRIKLGDSIVVTVVRLGRDKVRLGIEAPADMLVLREELETASLNAIPAEASASDAANGARSGSADGSAARCTRPMNPPAAA